MEEIPLHSQDIGRTEREIADGILSDNALDGDEYNEQAVDLLEKMTGSYRVFMTKSGTDALEMAAMLLDISSGDEVIMPSWTFPATANAFIREGAVPVFTDVDPETLTMDTDDLRDVIDEETAAVVPVHYAGVAAEMEEIMKIARRYDVPVVEDAAQGVNATYRGEPLGTIGDIGCYSFDWAKNYTAGEGGALLLNDRRFVEDAEMVHRSGTNYCKFSRGKVEYYSWSSIGSRFRPSELHAGLVCAQLEKRSEITEQRRVVHEVYHEELKELDAAGYIQTLTVPESTQTNYHIYYILCETQKERSELMETLSEAGISIAPHYRPLHSSSMGQEYGYETGDCPITERVADTLLRLPIHTNMTEDDARHVTEAISSYYLS